MDNNLATEIDKCYFNSQEVDFLGYIISPDGISMANETIRTIQEWTSSKLVKDVQVFIGFANFYRHFICNFSGICKPITDLLKGDSKSFVWSRAAEIAFQFLKACFTTQPILRHFDPSLESFLEVDASDFALGGVLSQKH